MERTGGTSPRVHHPQERLAQYESQNAAFAKAKAEKNVVFMPGWSAFAESAETARGINAMGLVWPGTEPVASDQLEKIGFKQICAEVGAPTPPFVVLAGEEFREDISDAGTKDRVVKEFVDKVLGMKTEIPGTI